MWFATSSLLYTCGWRHLTCVESQCSSKSTFYFRCPIPTSDPSGRTKTRQTLVSDHAAAKSLQSCSTLWDPIDGSPPSSPIPGILQARTLECVAISFSNAWKGKGKVNPLSHVWLLVTPWTAAHQAPPSVGFSRQECWSGDHNCHQEKPDIMVTTGEREEGSNKEVGE